MNSATYKNYSFAFMAALIISPFDIEIFATLRPLDFFLVFLIFSGVFGKPAVSNGFLFLIFSYLLVFILSAFLSSYGNFNILGSVFIYKYFILFSLPLVYSQVFTDKANLDAFIKIFFLVNFFLVLWVILYSPLREMGYIEGHYRPSYPFSDNFFLSDGHLLSSHICFFFLSYLMIGRIFLRHSIFITSLILLTCIYGLVATGSRNGFYVAMFFAFIYSVLKYPIQSIVLGLSMLLVLPVLVIVFQVELADFRTFSSIGGDDFSSLGRLAKFQIAISEIADNYYLFGKSSFFNTLNWYDGIHSIVLSHTGVLGLLIFIALIIFSFVKLYPSTFKMEYVILFFSYISLQFATEFIFVFRASFIALAFIFFIKGYSLKYTRYNE